MYRWLIIAALLVGGCGWFEDEPAVTYTVVRGDTLTKISKAYGVSVADLQKWNGLSGDQIEVGQVLAIESGGEPTQIARLKPRKPGKTVRKKTSSRKMPKPKPCLKGPSLDDLDVDDSPGNGSPSGGSP